MIPIQFIVAGVIAAAAFGAGWKFSGDSYAKQIANIHAEHSLALAEATENTRAIEAKWHATVAESERLAAVREADLVRSLNRTRVAADGLRNDLSAARSALPTASCPAVREYGIATSVVIGECSARLVEVAEHADRAIGEVMLLRDAWPVSE